MEFSWLQRLLAAIALAALLAAGAHCSWRILTDTADFSAARTQDPEPGS